MVLVIVTVAAALVVGLIRGGRIAHLSSAQLRGTALVAVAAIAQFLHALTAGTAAGVALTVVSQGALLVFLWWNRLLPGVLLVALGSSANALVVALNGAMPVSADAMLAVTRHPQEVAGGRHRLLRDGDALPWLADVIGLPPLRTVVSVGDVVLAAGVAVLVIALLQPPRSRSASAVSRAASRRSR